MKKRNKRPLLVLFYGSMMFGRKTSEWEKIHGGKMS